ncbi:MAG: precorrin-8X methylmutase, partial [Clostridia bacterium]|nr:precorrin-8X methylmutase [Clostridia bacterium]
MDYIQQPKKIEATSFEIIEKELGNKALKYDEKTLKIVKRVIHTTADFEYGDLIKFHPLAVEAAMHVLKKGCRIYADTKMIMAGINRRKLSELNCEIYNLSHDKDVFEEAEKRGITRSMVGMEKAFDDDATQIFVIGNAPTALFKLKEL